MSAHQHMELNEFVHNSNESVVVGYAERFFHCCIACPYLGIILATTSTIFLSLCTVIVRELIDVHPIELASYRLVCNKQKNIKSIQTFCCRFLGILLPVIPVVLYKQQPVFPKGKRMLLMLLCFVASLSILSSFYAFRHVHSTNASAILCLTPLFVVAFARAFLREPCNLYHVVVIVLNLLAIAFITRPTLWSSVGAQHIDVTFNDDGGGTDEDYSIHRHSLWIPVAAFCATVFGGNALVLFRALKGVSAAVIMANIGWFGCVYAAVAAWTIGGGRTAICWPPHCADRLAVIAIFVCGSVGQLLLIWSLQCERAGTVAIIVGTTDPLFGTVWQWLLIGDDENGRLPWNWSFVFGAFLMLTIVGGTALRAWTLASPPLPPSHSRECSGSIRTRLRLICVE